MKPMDANARPKLPSAIPKLISHVIALPGPCPNARGRIIPEAWKTFVPTQ